MLSQNKIKVIQSLDKKKFRQKYNLFVVEGIKNIKEFIKSAYNIEKIYAIEENLIFQEKEVEIITESQLEKISFLKTPHNALALVQIPEQKCLDFTGIQLVLDEIQDPGNLGTIIRLADWFGISQIICSKNTVDVYNPKVVQSTMGSLARVNLFYTDLSEVLSTAKNPVLTADMEGENIYKTQFPEDFFLVMGNEGNGISKEIFDLCSQRISIPRVGKSQQTESLNVAMACGIILGEVFSQREKTN